MPIVEYNRVMPLDENQLPRGEFLSLMKANKDESVVVVDIAD